MTPWSRKGANSRRLDRRDELACGRALGAFEAGRVIVGIRAGEGVVDGDLDGLDRARLHQSADHAVGDVTGQGEFPHQSLPLADPVERLLPLRRQPLGHAPVSPIFRDGAGAVQRARRGKGHPENGADRRQIIIRRPVDQAAERLGERRHIVDLEERAEPVVADLLRFQPLGIPDDAGLLPRPERGDHDRTRHGLHPLRHPIIERPKRGIEEEDSNAVHPPLDRVSAAKDNDAPEN